MKLNLITFASSLASRESIFTDHHELLDAIAERYDVRYIFPEELGDKPAEGATMVLVGSGGVEEMVKADIDRLPPYVVLIADGLKNSLAASLEILSWMRQAGRHGRVLHGPNDFIMRGIDDYATAHNAISKLSGKRVGVIGKPSGWLIASNVDYQAMRERWGEKAAARVPVVCWSVGDMLPTEGLHIEWRGPDLPATLLSFIDWCEAVRSGAKNPPDPIVAW